MDVIRSNNDPDNDMTTLTGGRIDDFDKVVKTGSGQPLKVRIWT